jgi:hypothetical protein
MKITIGYDSHASNVNVSLEGKCKTDFSDVRFVNKNNTAELNYWMENKTNGVRAQFWVKTNGDNALNIYYGNAAASSHSNGTTTFLLFDDFSESGLNTNLWEQINTGAGWLTVSGGTLTIASSGDWWSNADSSYSIVSKTSFPINYIAEASIINQGQDGYNRFFGLRSSSATTAKIFVLLVDGDRSHVTNVYRDSVGASANWYGENTGIVNPGNSKVAKFERIGDTVKSYYGGSVANIRTVSGWDLKYVSLTDTHSSANPTTFDWIRVRNYASPEPQWSSFGIEELALPTRPTLNQPSDNSVTVDTTPSFGWNASQNAVNQTLQVSHRIDFATVVLNASLGPSATTYTPTTGLLEGKWYWRVIANNTQGTNISSAWSFIIDTTAPHQPLLLSPIDNCTINNNHVTFSWNQTIDDTINTSDVSGIYRYQLQVSNNTFTSLLVNQNTSDNATLSITTTVAGRLQWRVRAWDKAGNPSIFSEVRALIVFDFSFTATSSSVTILRGGVGTTSVIVSVNFGNDETVTLSHDWLGIPPTGVTVAFSNESGNGDYSSTITFETNPNAATGEFILNVTATSLTGQRTLSIDVRIAGMIFQVSASPTTFSLIRSDTDQSTISVTFQYGSKESVSLSGDWIGTPPTGVTTSFSSVTDLPPFNSEVMFSTSKDATAGKYTYRITASGGGIDEWMYLTVTIKTNLNLTLQSDKPTYEKGQEIQLSGTVEDPNGNAVEQGAVTLTLSTGSWQDRVNATVTNGVYHAAYYITFDKFEGTWKISGTGTDSLGHTTTTATSITIGVTTPAIYKYYTIIILSPLPGQVYKRGDVVSFTVSVVENETKIRGATVTFQPPNGTRIVLSEISPGLYSTSYTLSMDCQLGNWTVYLEGSTTENQMFKAGFSYIPIRVEPIELLLELVEPTVTSYETGQHVTFTAKLLYPNGSPVEDGIVSATKNDGSVLNFKKSGTGLYSSTYTIQEADVGYLNVQVSAADVYGNVGSVQGTTLIVTPMQFSSYFVQYWWVTSIILFGLMFALGYVTRDVSRIVRLRNFKREVLQLNRLKKDKASEYFLRGSISRDAYDNLIGEYESKLAKIEKQKFLLEKKMHKKGK